MAGLPLSADSSSPAPAASAAVALSLSMLRRSADALLLFVEAVA
jgi:hypothetical protein